ncbi:MAG: bifunctional oligoribonuclease/PAP phosphatase NrnA [Deltaproteobacteria bacterium]|nr:bifunctional oligoribonuclease/PAP phosphatase NrnA [Deltaproteobacteria bacterium]
MSVQEAAITEVCLEISKASSFLVVSHFNPDADAYGSSCAMAAALRARGAQVALVNESAFSERFDFISGARETLTSVPAGVFDAAIVLDCGAIDRVGDRIRQRLAGCSVVLNIDHHASNGMFGTVNYVDEKSSSTCELVYRILKRLNQEITPPIAGALLAGIVGDTGSFRYPSTSAETFSVAENLVRCGASPSAIANAMFGNTTAASVMLQAEALRAIHFFNRGQAAEIVVTNEMYKRFGATAEDTEDLVERARDIQGVNVSVLIKQDGDIWRISLRSVSERFNVAAVAAKFGGGGHKMAAGFRFKRGLEELQSALRRELSSLEE